MKKIILSAILIIGCSTNSKGLDDTQPATDTATDTLTNTQSMGGSIQGTGGSTLTSSTTMVQGNGGMKGTGGSTTIPGTGGTSTISGIGGTVSFGGTTTIPGTGGATSANACVGVSAGPHVGCSDGFTCDGNGNCVVTPTGTGGVPSFGGASGGSVTQPCIGVPAGQQVPGLCDGDFATSHFACDGKGNCALVNAPAVGGSMGTGGSVSVGGTTTVQGTGGHVGTGGSPGTGGLQGTGGTSVVITTPDAGAPDVLVPKDVISVVDSIPACNKGGDICCTKALSTTVTLYYCSYTSSFGSLGCNEDHSSCISCGASGQVPCYLCPSCAWPQPSCNTGVLFNYLTGYCE